MDERSHLLIHGAKEKDHGTNKDEYQQLQDLDLERGPIYRSNLNVNSSHQSVNGMTRKRTYSRRQSRPEYITLEELGDIYIYYHEKGFYRLLLSKICGLLTFSFIASLLFFLGNVNYEILMDLSSNGSDLNKVINFSSLRWYTIIYLSIIGVVITVRLLTILLSIRKLYRIKIVYNYHLKIPDNILQVVTWDYVVKRLLKCPTCRIHSLNGGELNVLDVANVIMRKENYFIALMDNEVIPLTDMTSNLEWHIDYCIIDHVINTPDGRELLLFKNRDRDELIKILRRKMFIMATLKLLSSPFLFIYKIIRFILEYGETAYNNPKLLGSRNWNLATSYNFREYNELQHIFNERLMTATPHVQTYINSFSSVTFDPIYQCGIFISGSLLIIIILLNLISNNLILTAKIFGVNIFTCITILGLLITVFRSLYSADKSKELSKEVEKSMNEIITHLKYVPSSWTTYYYQPNVRDEVCSYYQYRILLGVKELLSPFTTPIKLFQLSDCLPDIVDFLHDNTSDTDNIGYICTQASFTHKHINDEDKENVDSHYDICYDLSDYRLEQSYINFKHRHPNWNYDNTHDISHNNTHDISHDNTHDISHDNTHDISHDNTHDISHNNTHDISHNNTHHSHGENVEMNVLKTLHQMIPAKDK
jgi:autophagy-related protein 9